MNVRALFAATAIAALLPLTAACATSGSKTTDSGGKLAQTPENRTVSPTKAGGPTPVVPDDFGPAPVLGGNITVISPKHGQKVTQASTRSPNPKVPNGVCAEVNFTDLPENFQWFQMAVDDQRVTDKLTLVASTAVDPKDGKICYAPAEGLSVGKHTAAIAVQAPRDASVPTRQLVSWAFEVVP
jgi:hypothetical protein